MSIGNVIPIAPRASVDEAWEAYQEKAAEQLANPRLQLDRGFQEELVRRRRKWEQLFALQGRGA